MWRGSGGVDTPLGRTGPFVVALSVYKYSFARSPAASFLDAAV